MTACFFTTIFNSTTLVCDKRGQITAKMRRAGQLIYLVVFIEFSFLPAGACQHYAGLSAGREWKQRGEAAWPFYGVVHF